MTWNRSTIGAGSRKCNYFQLYLQAPQPTTTSPPLFHLFFFTFYSSTSSSSSSGRIRSEQLWCQIPNTLKGAQSHFRRINPSKIRFFIAVVEAPGVKNISAALFVQLSSGCSARATQHILFPLRHFWTTTETSAKCAMNICIYDNWCAVAAAKTTK